MALPSTNPKLDVGTCRYEELDANGVLSALERSLDSSEDALVQNDVLNGGQQEGSNVTGAASIIAVTAGTNLVPGVRYV